MRRLLALPVGVGLVVVETYRRGYAAPILYGLRQWWALLKRVNEEYEPEAFG